MPDLYPVFLKLDGRAVLVVGGGPMAAAKLRPLVGAGALVRVVAPEVLPEIEAVGVPIERRPFRPGDLDGVWYVVAAATPDVNAQVARAAEARRIFVNAVDDPANASAYLGGVLRRGGVTIATSTTGDAPALAGLIREGLEAVLPDDLADWRALALEERRKWRLAGVPMAERRPRLLEALNRQYDNRQDRLARAVLSL